MRRSGRGMLSALAVVLLGGMLAGCANGGTEPAPTEIATDAAVSSEAPVETAPELTDEEALQIAVETYEEYLAVSGELIDTHGESFAQLEAITTENMTVTNQEALEFAQTNEFQTEGIIPVTEAQVIRQSNGEIQAIVCADLSQSRTLDADGNVISGDRSGVSQAFDVDFVFDNGKFKVDRNDLWSQSDFCSQ